MNWVLGRLPIVGFGFFLLRYAQITFGPTSFLQVWVIVSATLDSPLQEIISDQDKEAILGGHSHWWPPSEEDENSLRTPRASNDFRCSICLLSIIDFFDRVSPIPPIGRANYSGSSVVYSSLCILPFRSAYWSAVDTFAQVTLISLREMCPSSKIASARSASASLHHYANDDGCPGR
ncbi:hypothetical protein BJX62DRAFT_208465 [Aspergillus germanicus]